MRSAAALLFISIIGVASIICGLTAGAAAGGAAQAEAATSSTTHVHSDDWLAVIRVHDEAHVRGPNIVLGDIALIETADERLRGELQRLFLGRAALPGQSRELHVATMLTRMRQQRLPVQHILLESSTPEVSVRTLANTVSGAELARAALATIDTYVRATPAAAAGDPQWLLDCALPDALTVADGPLSIRVPRVSGTAPGALVAATEVAVDGVVQRTVMVRCDTALEREVLVAAVHLQRHDDLQPDAVTVERRKFTSLPREALLPLDATDEPGKWRVTATGSTRDGFDGRLGGTVTCRTAGQQCEHCCLPGRD